MSVAARYWSTGFPGYGWAWPRGDRELLLKAAALPDLEKAVEAFRQWSAHHDFEATTLTELRLLVGISARLPARLITLDERARLTGIERMLWTRSRVALAAAEDAARILAGLGVDMLVIKGASRSALDLSNLKGRAAYDIDLLVKPQDFRRSIEALMANGWKDDHPKLVMRYLAGTGGMAAVNLGKGEHGDVDLHQYALYHVAGGNDRGLWERSREVDFLKQKIRVASPADNLAIAIANGGIGGHGQSDWMVDCVNIIREGGVDWTLFEDICAAHRILPHAAITLGFLKYRLEAPVPEEVLGRIARAGRRPFLRRLSALFQAHPKRELPWWGVAGRGLSRGMRQLRSIAWSRRYAFDPPVEPPARAG
jgi:hypothetical protein